MERAQKEIKEFLFARMYRHAAVMPVWRKARRRSCAACSRNFSPSPKPCRKNGRQAARPCDDAGRARVVSDYIAGMTDRYALAQAEKWLDDAEKQAGR